MKTETSARDTAVLLAIMLLVWVALNMALGDQTMPSPLQTIEKAIAIVRDADFSQHLSATASAFAIAFGLSCVVGLTLGTLMGTRDSVRESLEPPVFGLLAVPKVAFYPVILLLFGLGMPAKVCFGFLHGLPVLALVVAGAIKNIRPVYLRVALSMNLSPRATYTSVVLPYAMPEIVSGLQLAFAITLQGVLIGELFASKEGLGFLLMQAIGIGDARTALALTLLIAIAVTFVNAVMRRLKSRATGGWERNARADAS